MLRNVTSDRTTHARRAKKIRAAHPDVQELIGRNPWTALIGLGLVGLQLAGAYAVVHFDVAWPWALLAGALVGCHVVHALYAVVHETTHRLVFRSSMANRMLNLVCNLPLVFPFTVVLSHYHLVHHRHLGRVGRDPDLPARWERRFFAGGPLIKIVYACLFPALQLLRPIDARDRIRPTNPWLLANVALQAAVVVAVLASGGWAALVYLASSVYFWAGPHPVLFARYVQEHFLTGDDPEETHSYYGWLNRITLNVGYHVEHHDVPSIPYNRLPALHAIAAEFYADRKPHMSWTRLMWRFIFEAQIQVSSRVMRGAPDSRHDVRREKSIRSPPAPRDDRTSLLSETPAALDHLVDFTARE